MASSKNKPTARKGTTKRARRPKRDPDMLRFVEASVRSAEALERIAVAAEKLTGQMEELLNQMAQRT